MSVSLLGDHKLDLTYATLARAHVTLRGLLLFTHGCFQADLLARFWRSILNHTASLVRATSALIKLEDLLSLICA